MNKNQTLLIIGFVWPEPNSSAAGSRMMQLISIFKANGFTIVFASPAQDSPYMIDFEDIEIIKKSIALNCSSFDYFLKELNPDIVMFDRFMMEEQFGWRVTNNCPDALRLLDTEDLHCLRLARQRAFKKKQIFTTTDLLEEETAKREVASILRCDLSLFVSEFEIDLLQSVFKIDCKLLYYLPLLVDFIDDLKIQKLPSFEQRANFVFIGNFLHEPNVNCVQFLKETIWPIIRKQFSEASLHIYGAYPNAKVQLLHNPKDNFYCFGRTDDAQETVKNARVLLAPLRFGAGMKGKFLEAMQCGTPSVTTAIGAESMFGTLPWNGFIADEPELFAGKAAQLYNEKELWQKAQENGFTIIKNRYLKSSFESNFVEHISNLQKKLKAHRLQNFIGSLLQHHTVASTKYMSRWIEEKNRKN